MFAIAVWDDPELLDGEIFSDDEGRRYDLAFIIRCCDRYKALIQYLSHMHIRTFSLTHTDIVSMPHTLFQAINIFNRYMGLKKQNDQP